MTKVTTQKKNSKKSVGFSNNIFQNKKSELLDTNLANEYFNTAGVLLVVLDTKGNVVKINKRGLEILGYKEKEVLGKNWISLCIPKELRRNIQKLFKSILRKKIKLTGEYNENHVVTSKGEIKTLLFHNTIILDKKKKIIGVLSSGEDITKIKKLYDDLKDYEKKYHITIDSLQDIIHVIDKNKKIILWNKAVIAWNKKFELTTKLEGKTIEKVYPFLSKKVIEDEYGKVFKLGETVITEEKNVLNGKEIYTETRKIPIFEDKIVSQVITIVRDITDRVRAQNIITSNEKKFRSLIENSNDIINVLDTTGKIIFESPSAAKILGYKKGWSNIGGNIFERVHPDDIKKAKDKFKEILLQKTSILNTLEARYKDSENRWRVFEVSVVNALNNPEINGVIVTSHDITDKAKIDNELREKRRELITLLSNLPGMAYRCKNDKDWTMNFVSFGCEELTGYKPFEIINNKVISFENIIHPDDKKIVRETVENGLRKNKQYEIRYRIITKNKTEKWVLERGVGVYENKKLVSLEGFIMDITERQIFINKLSKKSIELEKNIESLKETQRKLSLTTNDLNKFKLAVDQASDHIIITNPKGEILYANLAAQKITGYSVSEMLGKTPALWGRQMKSDFYKAFWKKIKDDKAIFVGEFNNKRKNGELYIAEVSVSPIIDKDRNIIFYVGIERDITKIKEIDKAKTEFVSLASHQLRTPLSIINWYSEMLLGGDAGKITDKQKKYVSEIYRGSQRMVELVGSLLNSSRIELGTFSVEPKPENICQIVESTISDFQEQINKKSLIVSTICPKNIPIINIDKKLTEIIFQNIISNSVKYTPKNGKITLELSTTKTDVLIKIADTGYGIPDNQKDKIFTKLFRADNIRDKEVDGTGLGLYITKSVIDQSGGKMWFESKENEGTTFYVSIPLSGMKRRKEAKNLL